jgi:hypothetical protein
MNTFMHGHQQSCYICKAKHAAHTRRRPHNTYCALHDPQQHNQSRSNAHKVNGRLTSHQGGQRAWCVIEALMLWHQLPGCIR